MANSQSARVPFLNWGNDSPLEHQEQSKKNIMSVKIIRWWLGGGRLTYLKKSTRSGQSTAGQVYIFIYCYTWKRLPIEPSHVHDQPILGGLFKIYQSLVMAGLPSIDLKSFSYEEGLPCNIRKYLLLLNQLYSHCVD